MRVLFLQHDAFSPPTQVAERFADRGYDVEEQLVVPAELYHRPGEAQFTFPDPTDYDAIVPMGSPWGAWDDEMIGPWLGRELQWLRDADAAGVPVMGICFGGQLLARAHGGSVARAPHCEIGWTAVMTDEPSLVEAGPWFQFHYDRWSVPPGAREIARTPRASQAFTLRRNLALQFHPELTGSMLEGWYASPGNGIALVAADGQDPAILLAQTRSEESGARDRAHRLVDAFLDRVAGA